MTATTEKAGMTMTEQPCIDHQRAEWMALHERMRELAEAHREALRDSGSWIAWGIEHPNNAVFVRKQARAAAKLSIALWAERAALEVVVEAHPYTAVVNGSREARGQTS